MIIEPKIRDFICTTAHPDGCAEHVRRQADYVRAKGRMDGPKRVLVIGASTGYGLASRIAAAFGCGASTLGVSFERPASGKRTATPGWYNTAAFDRLAAEDGLYAASINGDAFSPEIKAQAIERIRSDMGKADMVIYSLASPRRKTAGGVTYSSVLKTTGKPYTNKTIDLKTNEVNSVTIPVATDEEIRSTVKVMGGEDWMDWITALSEAGVLENGAVTLAYSYIGPELTFPVYYEGSIGMAKKHLYDTSAEITRRFSGDGVRAYISVNKAVVTQASAAIPMVPLYIALLFKVMKEKGGHEGCIEQMDRLFREKLAGGGAVTDAENRIRLDDYEMRDEIQREVLARWDKANSANIRDLADIDGYWEDFYHMFGFRYDNIDYQKDVDLT